MGLALFDLDNTLIAGDSDHLWGDFLVNQGLVDPQTHKAQNELFYRQYQEGRLDIDEYLSFALGPMAGMTPESLSALQRIFVKEHIEPILLDRVRTLTNKLKPCGSGRVRFQEKEEMEANKQFV